MKKLLFTLILSSITFLSIGQIKIYGIDITKTGGSNTGWKWDALIGTYVKNTSTSTPFDAVYKFPDRDFTFLTYTGEYKNMHERYAESYKYLKSNFGKEFTTKFYGGNNMSIEFDDNNSFVFKGRFFIENDSTDYLKLEEMFEKVFIHSEKLYSIWHLIDKKTGNNYDIILTWNDKGLTIKQKNWGNDLKEVKTKRIMEMLNESMIKGLRAENEKQQIQEEKEYQEAEKKKLEEEKQEKIILDKKKAIYQKKIDAEKRESNILEKGIYAEITDIGKLKSNDETIKGIKVTFVNDTKKTIVEFTGIINADVLGYVMNKHSSRITEISNLKPGQKVEIVYPSKLYNVAKSVGNNEEKKKELLLNIFKKNPQIFHCESIKFSDGEKIKR